MFPWWVIETFKFLGFAVSFSLVCLPFICLWEWCSWVHTSCKDNPNLYRRLELQEEKLEQVGRSIRVANMKYNALIVNAKNRTKGKYK